MNMNEDKNDSKNIQLFENLNNFHFDSYTDSYISDSFCIFVSINDILNLIYSNESKSIIVYDLNNEQKMCEIKNAHDDFISSFKHILDEKEKKDLLISVSYDSNYLKLWEIKNMKCLCHIQNINNDGFLFCAHFLSENFNDSHNLYILTTNCNFYHNSGPIKKYDLKGNQIDILNNSEGLDILYLTDFCDVISQKQYLVAGTKRNILSFDIENNKIHQTFERQNDCMHCNIIINTQIKEGIIYMIETGTDGKLRIWDFHGVKILKTINVSNTWLYGMCLWDNNLIFVGDGNKNLRLIDLDKGEVIQILPGNNRMITTIKKNTLKKYGECLITQEYLKGEIKLWKKI